MPRAVRRSSHTLQIVNGRSLSMADGKHGKSAAIRGVLSKTTLGAGACVCAPVPSGPTGSGGNTPQLANATTGAVNTWPRSVLPLKILALLKFAHSVEMAQPCQTATVDHLYLRNYNAVGFQTSANDDK